MTGYRHLWRRVIVSVSAVAAIVTCLMPRPALFGNGAVAAAENQPAKVVPGIPPKAQKGAATAIAVPLRDITIDGKLDDWPKKMVKHYVLNELNAVAGYSPSRYDTSKHAGADLTSNPDLSAYFMVGYEPNIDLEYDAIYVALVVRDDTNHVRFAGPYGTDAVEVYIDGDHGERQLPFSQQVGADEMPAQQYIAVPGDGPAYGSPDGNPAFYVGGIKETKARMAYHRAGDITTYEWSIQAFDRFPDQPTSLVPGKRIGFDVAVADKDSDADKPRWVSWGPGGSMKHFNAHLLGDLIMGRGD